MNIVKKVGRFGLASVLIYVMVGAGISYTRGVEEALVPGVLVGVFAFFLIWDTVRDV